MFLDVLSLWPAAESGWPSPVSVPTLCLHEWLQMCNDSDQRFDPSRSESLHSSCWFFCLFVFRKVILCLMDAAITLSTLAQTIGNMWLRNKREGRINSSGSHQHK